MFNKILIANRGEIAVRIIRACKEMGIRTVAVFSEADRESLHANLADEAICIGPPYANQSYLNIPNIISAAEITGANAVHPGYGFLAENSHFAEVCKSHDLVFIGPEAQMMDMLGDKIQAKETARKAKFPVIPGSPGEITDPSQAMKVAEEMGFPVIIKAAAGGGGRGMRIVQNERELEKNIMLAQTEAQAAFGNPAVYVEKYLEEPRHIEVQVLADGHGNVIHLGERDCSIQRRHQKLIEEAPSPFVDDELRSNLGDAAVRLVKSVGYIGAGTVECLVDKHKNFYFMEVNTRVQVEHPVSETITDVDIIKEQIRVAAGEKLKHQQKDIKIRGHAIEFRINAEDPDRDFQPSPGKLTLYNPSGGPGVRVDSHAYTGYVVPPYYDSMIAKLIVKGETRDEAIDRADRALEEFIVTGIKTTIPFHQRVVANAFFRKGEVYTNFVARRIYSEE